MQQECCNKDVCIYIQDQYDAYMTKDQNIKGKNFNYFSRNTELTIFQYQYETPKQTQYVKECTKL